MIEQYSFKSKYIERTVIRRSGSNTVSKILATSAPVKTSLHSAHDFSWLTSSKWPIHSSLKNTCTLVDLFSGCGAMSLGVWEACRALGIQMIPRFAIDTNKEAAATYKKNFPESDVRSQDIYDFLDGNLGKGMTEKEKSFVRSIGNVDFLIGGPPCQGHSDLNNHTRRNDPKNLLIYRMARFAEIFSPENIIIENVQGIKHDKNNAAHKTKVFLEKLGYFVDDGVLLASTIGVPQNRRRFLMVASKSLQPVLTKIPLSFGTDERSLSWACNDLVRIKKQGVFNTSAKHSEINQKRIKYLFENNLYDLPNSQRPDCHRLKKHSYNAVYGRLYLNKPSPTITTGFGSTGQGRFVHPLQQRTLTPHEAARLQFIPDFFDFGELGRRSLQLLIGNAVPTKLATVIAMDLLR
jgi:DNA (cytosine-5)-methyltransferase 1